MAVAGDIKEITFNHPTLGSGTFKPLSDEDATFDLGGLKTNDDEAITSDGEKINKLKNTPWMFEGVVRWSSIDGLDLEKLTNLSGSTEDSDWTFELADGSIYGGTGRPVGDIQGSSKDGQISLKITGGSKLRQI